MRFDQSFMSSMQLHIATSSRAEMLSSSPLPRGVFDLHDQLCALTFSDTLMRLGKHLASISANFHPEQAIPGLDCECLHEWRSLPPSEHSHADERIDAWRRGVGEYGLALSTIFYIWFCSHATAVRLASTGVIPIGIVSTCHHGIRKTL